MLMDIKVWGALFALYFLLIPGKDNCVSVIELLNSFLCSHFYFTRVFPIYICIYITKDLHMLFRDKGIDMLGEHYNTGTFWLFKYKNEK